MKLKDGEKVLHVGHLGDNSPVVVSEDGGVYVIGEKHANEESQTVTFVPQDGSFYTAKVSEEKVYSKGPAKVNSKSYQAGWNNVFGGKAN